MGPRGASGRGVASGQTFQLGDGSAAARAETASPVVSAQDINALLALQAVEDPLLKRKKLVRRGTALLDTLDELHADLLTGRASDSRLNQLMALIGQAREQSEPGLDALLDDIELRARVELAKRGLFPGQ